MVTTSLGLAYFRMASFGPGIARSGREDAGGNSGNRRIQSPKGSKAYCWVLQASGLVAPPSATRATCHLSTSASTAPSTEAEVDIVRGTLPSTGSAIDKVESNEAVHMSDAAPGFDGV